MAVHSTPTLEIEFVIHRGTKYMTSEQKQPLQLFFHRQVKRVTVLQLHFRRYRVVYAIDISFKKANTLHFDEF